MFGKGFIFGILTGIILTGASWFFVGRNNIGEIRASFNTVNGDFKTVERTVGELGIDSDGFAGEISTITITSKSIGNRSRTIDEGLTIVSGDIGYIASQVDKLEEWNRQSILLGRDLGDVAFDLRRLSEESGAAE